MGQPALKVHGKMFVCIASHKSAEPNSLVVMMAVADREALVDECGSVSREHGTSWSAHTASSASRCGVSRTAAAAERRLGHHAIAVDQS
jgi:hypothetical protein